MPDVVKMPPGGGEEDSALPQTHVPELLAAFGDVREVSLTDYYGCVRNADWEAWC